MINIKLAFIALIFALTVLWTLADTMLPAPFTYFSLRSVLVQYTGIIAVGTMSAALVLALRLKWLEPYLNGLDKMYRLHKWLGITALVFGLIHWWWAQGTKWMVGWGMLARPERGSSATQTLGPVESLLRTQRGVAEFLGEWAFYAAVALIVLALWKRFPYHLFVKTHKWLAALYLVFVYHAAILVKFAYWTQPIGWAVAVLLLAGTLAAMACLLGRIGSGRKVQGEIESIIDYPELRVLETSIRLSDQSWPGHSAGQFAFVTSRKDEGAHPYTIASAWDPDERRVVFITKALGDHTARLKTWLKAGMSVTVEGPYGCFDFRGKHACQIWVGAGIGITPFIARMKYLARSPGAQEIFLFHPTADFSQVAIDKLTADAKAANVSLHVLVDARDGLLSGERIRAAVPGWRSASLWFCGPSALGETLRQDFAKHGFPAADFHQEMFEMR
ncbi:ferric reductase-like transmembrane domain-containing protein [Dongia sp.]|uniref:ferredoxin reductase family protein n=1 Tax=Dongia sp. TaxID=1977262 RepID=UPI0035AFB062